MANTPEIPADDSTEGLQEVGQPVEELSSAPTPTTHVVTDEPKRSPIGRLIHSDGYLTVVGVLAFAAFILSVVALGQIAGQDNSVGGFDRPDRGSMADRIPGGQRGDGPRMGIPDGERPGQDMRGNGDGKTVDPGFANKDEDKDNTGDLMAPGQEMPEGMDSSDAARS